MIKINTTCNFNFSDFNGQPCKQIPIYKFYMTVVSKQIVYKNYAKYI